MQTQFECPICRYQPQTIRPEWNLNICINHGRRKGNCSVVPMGRDWKRRYKNPFLPSPVKSVALVIRPYRTFTAPLAEINNMCWEKWARKKPSRRVCFNNFIWPGRNGAACCSERSIYGLDTPFKEAERNLAAPRSIIHIKNVSAERRWKGNFACLKAERARR